MKGQAQSSEWPGSRDSVASQHMDYYVMLSKHSHCEFNSVSGMRLEISPAGTVLALSQSGTTGFAFHSSEMGWLEGGGSVQSFRKDSLAWV